MNYHKIYQQLNNRAKKRKLLGYYEEHHIIPKCLGGTDHKNNIAQLTGREHFIAHRLLVKMHPQNDSLIFALHMMLVKNKQHQRPAKNYEYLKIAHSAAMSRLHKGKKLSDKQKQQVSDRFKGKPSWNKGLPKELNPQTGKKRPGVGGRKPGFTSSRKGVKGASEETRIKISNSHKKNNSPSFNTQGYQVLTPSGFQDFQGVAYKGLVETLKFTLSDTSTIICSKQHKFVTPLGTIEAKDCLIGTVLVENITITNIVLGGRQKVYDLLEVSGDNSYYTNNVISHNCELIMDEDSSVVPEFTLPLQEEIIKDHPRPPFYDPYVAGDLGAKDFTVFLFAYYDFRNAKIIVEDEVVLKGGSRRTTTDLMAAEIKKKEAILWVNPMTKENIKPYKRVCDNDLLVINNLLMQNNLLFQATDKYDSHAALNNMRMLLKNRQIIIHPRCKTLIQHLKYATWATNKKTYARDTNNGHYDAVDALKYLVRNVQMTKNPYPHNFGLGSGDNWWKGFNTPENTTSLPMTTVENIKNIFKIRPTIKFNKRK